MSETTQELVARAASSLEGVTDGPWVTGQSGWNNEGDVYYTLHGIKFAVYADCGFIAAARQLVPDLHHELTAALAREAGLREAVLRYRNLDEAWNCKVRFGGDPGKNAAIKLEAAYDAVTAALTVKP